MPCCVFFRVLNLRQKKVEQKKVKTPSVSPLSSVPLAEMEEIADQIVKRARMMPKETRLESKMPTRIFLHRMFDGHDPRWKKGKSLMKIMYGVKHSEAMSNEEYMKCQSFVIGTMEGSDWPTDNLTDEMSFRALLQLSYKGCSDLGFNAPWRILKLKYEKDKHWPVFEERGGKCYVAFFHLGLRKTEWVEFTQEFVRSLKE